MKQLVLMRQNPNLQNEPTPAEISTWVDQTAAYMKEIASSGQGESPFFFQQGRGGGMILEADSPSEMQSLIGGVPISPICTVETFPIVEPDAFVQSLQEVFASESSSGGASGGGMEPGANG